MENPRNPKHNSPNKPAPKQPERAEETHEVSDHSDSDVSDDNDNELSLNGVSPGAMNQNPDVHAKYVGLRVVFVESADASPVLGAVKKSKKQNQQASFKLLLDDDSTALAQCKEHRRCCLGTTGVRRSAEGSWVPSHGGRRCRREQGRWRFRSCDVVCLML